MVAPAWIDRINARVSMVTEDCATSEHQIDHPQATLVEHLRDHLEQHLASLGLTALAQNGQLSFLDKETIRANHRRQRQAYAARELRILAPQLPTLLTHFASGHEIDPERVTPALELVHARTETGALFRLATLLWSVPVSRGFGRRMRFLVRDQHNGKLIGLFALGDPVFNLRARDEWIGWSVRDREQRLVHVMDAYVVGAIPPYSNLLGGKLVTSLMGSAEVAAHFEAKYADRRGHISAEVKPAKLALITVTSALGRSSLYNRLRLNGLVELIRIGQTQGWGHFQISGDLFEEMRQLLAYHHHPYASGHRFGQGPNWRIRVIREALRLAGLDQNLLRHGIPREVFAMPLYRNWRTYLQGETNICDGTRPSVAQLGQAAQQRWLIPRAARRTEYRHWSRDDTERLLYPVPFDVLSEDEDLGEVANSQLRLLASTAESGVEDT